MLLSRLALRSQVTLNNDFPALALGHQLPRLAGNDGQRRNTWLVLGGRGAGKTRAGAEFVRGLVHADPVYAEHRYLRIALVGESEHDGRSVMIEGPSGLLATAPAAQRPTWIASRRLLQWPNGAVAQLFSATDPNSLRGPQFDAAWCDEIAKWPYPDAAFDMLQLALRLGDWPQQIVTTTPRPIPLIKRLLADDRTLVTRAATAANKEFLSPAFLATVTARYGGTRLGRQELDGEIVDDRPGALWSRAMIEEARIAKRPVLEQIAIGIDPPASSRPGADACGLVVVGSDEGGTFYVMEDASEAGLSPMAWASKAVALFHKWEATRLVAEVNMGGDMVRAVISQVDPCVPVFEVRAKEGKRTRAEPVSALYEQHKVKHVGSFPALEDEMCDFGCDGLSGGRSPDRLDALVWAVTARVAMGRGPSIRML